LAIGDCPYTGKVGGRERSPPEEAYALVRDHVPVFTLSANHTCVRASKFSLEDSDSPHREAASDVYLTICNTYELTLLPLPHRTVKPRETWQTRMPRYFLPRGKLVVQEIALVCTFEGVRTANGRKEGYISLRGVVQGRGSSAEQLGTVTGSA